MERVPQLLRCLRRRKRETLAVLHCQIQRSLRKIDPVVMRDARFLERLDALASPQAISEKPKRLNSLVDQDSVQPSTSLAME